MIYLILSILFNAMMSIVMRVAENRVKYKVSMIAVNYLAAAVTGMCFLGQRQLFPDVERMGYAVGLGLVNGFFFMSALISCQYCISCTGIVLPSVFSRMGGLLVPLAFSILMFGEMPGAFQIIGSVLAIAGILMMTAQGRSGQKISCVPFLVLVLITEGVANSMTKVYQETGNTVLSDQFLLYTFMSACLLCVITLIARRERPGLKELIFGTLIGVPNFINTHFMLRTLERMPAVIVYPSRSVGALALITLTGILIFKERLSRRQVVAMVIIVAALLLLNL